MATWKKVLVSGSSIEINGLTADGNITFSSIVGSANNGNYLSIDGSGNVSTASTGSIIAAPQTLTVIGNLATAILGEDTYANIATSVPLDTEETLAFSSLYVDHGFGFLANPSNNTLYLITPQDLTTDSSVKFQNLQLSDSTGTNSLISFGSNGSSDLRGIKFGSNGVITFANGNDRTFTLTSTGLRVNANSVGEFDFQVSTNEKAAFIYVDSNGGPGTSGSMYVGYTGIDAGEVGLIDANSIVNISGSVAITKGTLSLLDPPTSTTLPYLIGQDNTGKLTQIGTSSFVDSIQGLIENNINIDDLIINFNEGDNVVTNIDAILYTATESIESLLTAASSSYNEGDIAGTPNQIVFTQLGSTANNDIGLSASLATNIIHTGSLLLSASGDNQNVLKIVGSRSTASFEGLISASELRVQNDIAIGGNLFSFTGTSFIENLVATLTGSNAFGSGSDPSNVTQQFTGSVFITGSQLSITGGNINTVGGGYVSSSGTLFASLSLDNTVNNVTMYDPATGQFYYTSSTALSVDLVLGDDDAYDGLFDWNANTTLPDAVGDLNGVLQALAPPPPPILDDITDSDLTNVTLAFGSQSAGDHDYNTIVIGTNTYVTAQDLAGFSNVYADGDYNATTTSNNRRLGVQGTIVAMEGPLNADVPAHEYSYPADAFRDGDKGSLKIYHYNTSLAETLLHTVDLTTFGSGNSLNSNSSGFNLSAATSVEFANGTAFDTFKYRTGTWKIGVGDQHAGWNAIRVVHDIDGNETTTNWIEWINDPQGVNISNSNIPVVGTYEVTAVNNDTNYNYLSGVKYYKSFNAEFNGFISENVYKYVYDGGNNAVEFNCSGYTEYTSEVTLDHTYANTTLTLTNNDSSPSLALPPTAVTEPGQLSIIEDAFDYTITFSSSLSSVVGDYYSGASVSSLTAGVEAKHPLKTNGTADVNMGGILFDGRATQPTRGATSAEVFSSENLRLPIGAYNTQNSVTSTTYNSQTSLATNDELLVTMYGGGFRLVYPTQGLNGGNYNGITNSPSNNVNYSSLTGNRKYLTYFQNGPSVVPGGTIVISGETGTIVPMSTSLTGNNIHVRIKLPGKTAWLDLATAPGFSDTLQTDNQGCLNGSLDNSLSATNNFTVNNGGNGVNIVANDYVVVEIEAGSGWTGRITSISMSF